MNITRKALALSVAAALTATGVMGASVRQLIGTNAANQCRVAVDSYVALAEAQEKDLKTMAFYLEAILDNPFSAFGVTGPLTTLTAEVRNRGDDLADANSDYLDSCASDGGLYAAIVDPYTDPIRAEKWEAEFEVKDAAKEVQRLVSQL